MGSSSSPLAVPELLSLLERERATAILRANHGAVGSSALEAAVRGGFRVVEVTLTTPGAHDLIASFASRPGLVVGAGTVLDGAAARRAVAAGASFLVSPVVDVEVIATAAELGVAMIAGTHTPTEMLAAHRAGAPLQKLFPAPGLGPAYVRACLGPLPFLRLVPTNGVDSGNVGRWLDAGAFAVGFTTSLFVPEELAGRRYDAIEGRARAAIAAVDEWRRQRSS